jgi:hypothetical protein
LIHYFLFLSLTVIQAGRQSFFTPKLLDIFLSGLIVSSRLQALNLPALAEMEMRSETALDYGI